MKAISLSYVFMLLMCIFAGFIIALMYNCSVLWGGLFMCVFAWSLVPFRELRKKVPLYPDFSTVLFVISFAVLVVIVASVTLLMGLKTFLSVMCTASSWLALLMTAFFVSFVPRNPNLQREVNK